MDIYACLPSTITLTLLLLSLTHFVIWPFFDLWPLIPLSDKEVNVDTFASLTKTNTLTLLLLSFDTVILLFDLSLTFDPLTVDRAKRSPWTLMHVCPTPTHWHCYFSHLTHFVIWPFFDLWPLIRRSDKEVTVDTFAFLTKTNTFTLFLLSFDTFCNLTFLLIFDPLTVGRMKRSPWTLMHVCPTPTHWHNYFCHLTHFVIWPFWPLNP